MFSILKPDFRLRSKFSAAPYTGNQDRSSTSQTSVHRRTLSWTYRCLSEHRRPGRRWCNIGRVCGRSWPAGDLWLYISVVFSVESRLRSHLWSVSSFSSSSPVRTTEALPKTLSDWLMHVRISISSTPLCFCNRWWNETSINTFFFWY